MFMKTISAGDVIHVFNPMLYIQFMFVFLTFPVIL